MSEPQDTKRFYAVGCDVLDTAQQRVANFLDEEAAQLGASFMNGATHSQIEAYIWEAAK